MFEDIFFIIVYGIIALFQERRYGCLTAILIAVLLIVIIGKLAY